MDRIESVIIPQPLIVVIEDVGWWSGYSRPELNQPFRTGMERIHCPEDYEAIIRLAKALKTQIISGFVLCEWDRAGILRELPSATWMGTDWHGCIYGNEFQKQAVSIINNNPDYLKIAMHGVGHECWIDGKLSRSEFHDENCVMHDREQVVRHIKMYEKLLRSTGINAIFPDIFIPPALKHSFGNGNQGFQGILSDFGFRYVITVFEKAKKLSPPIYRKVTEECGVILIERGIAPVSWDHVAAEPDFSFTNPVIALHWANILHADPERNMEVADRWAEFLAEGAGLNDCVFFPDVMDALSQAVFYHLAHIQPVNGGVILDLSKAMRILSGQNYSGIYLKLPEGARINENDGWLESAGHIQKDLMLFKPARRVENVHVVF